MRRAAKMAGNEWTTEVIHVSRRAPIIHGWGFGGERSGAAIIP